MKLKTAAVALIASLGAMSFYASASTNLIVNGSFEDISSAGGLQQLATGSWQVFEDIPGWHTTKGPGIEVRNGVAGVAQDGNQFVELDSYKNSIMVQAIPTTLGQAYNLSFWYSPRPSTGDTNDINVFWNGKKIDHLEGSNNSSTNNWTNYTFTVLGTGSDKLRFAAAGTNDSYGGSLDNVSLISAVPEPATSAMFIAGLGLMGFIARRRRNG